MDTLSLSLDDIIKKNKKFKPKNDKIKKGVKSGKIVKKANVMAKKSITPKRNVDARMKIIQKKRTKIHDAREKIAQNTRRTIKDARELLSSRKPVVIKKKVNIARPRIPRSRTSHLTMDDDLLMDDDDIELEDLDKLKTKPIGSLRRTVQNDTYRSSSPPIYRSMPKLPTFSIQNRDVSPTIDPFDCYVVPTRRPVPLPPRNIPERYQPGRVMSAHMDAYAKDETRKSILRTSSRNDDHDDRFESDRYVTAEPKSSRYRETNESAGIFAKITSPPRSSSSSSIKGHRIIVSNLDVTVMENEMSELFSDIGEVLSSKIIRPGTAEIIFRHEGDDERAHEAYHNRILDGQPMKIILAGPTSKSAAYYRM